MVLSFVRFICILRLVYVHQLATVCAINIVTPGKVQIQLLPAQTTARSYFGFQIPYYFTGHFNFQVGHISMKVQQTALAANFPYISAHTTQRGAAREVKHLPEDSNLAVKGARVISHLLNHKEKILVKGTMQSYIGQNDKIYWKERIEAAGTLSWY